MDTRNISIGTIVRTKKLHPCGNDLWEVTRLGADVNLMCTKCKRQIQLSRSKLEKFIKKIEEHL